MGRRLKGMLTDLPADVADARRGRRRVAASGRGSASRGCTTSTCTSCRPPSSARCGRSSTRPVRRSVAGLADPLPPAPRGAGRDPARLRRAALLDVPYAHKPGVAGYLNDWSREFAAGVPEVIRRRRSTPSPRRPTTSPPRSTRGRGLRDPPAGGGVRARRPPARPGLGRARGRRHAPSCARRVGPVGNDVTGPDSMAAAAGRFPRLFAWWSPTSGRPIDKPFLGSARPTSGCTSTPQWCSPASSTTPFPAELVPGLSDLQPKVLSAPTSRPSRTRTRAAGGSGPARPGRRLAARGLLGQRCPAAGGGVPARPRTRSRVRSVVDGDLHRRVRAPE